jgi:hypothetical protein
VAIPYYFRLNYGALSGIAHHSIGLTSIADSPFGKGKKYLNGRVAGAALGGWQWNVVSIFRSGTPFTVSRFQHDFERSRLQPVRELPGPADEAGEHLSVV